MFYAYLESLIRKIDGCSKNRERSSTKKIGEHIPCKYSMSTISALDNIQNKHTLFCEKALYFFKRTCYKCNQFFFFKSTVNNKELKWHQDVRACYICGKIFSKKISKDEKLETITSLQVIAEAQHLLCII